MRRLNPLPTAMRKVADAAKRMDGGRAERKRAQRRRQMLRIGVRHGLPLLLLGGVAGSAVWAVESGVAARQTAALTAGFHRQTANLGLAVEDVLVRGRERTDRSAILGALGVQRGGPMLALSPRAARQRLEELPWVRSAAVERQLPNQVYVRLVERRPLALWQLDGRLSVIDAQGERIRGVDPNAFANLPLVVGPGAGGQAERLLAALRAEPELARRMRAAVRVSERRWNVQLDNGVDVQLPEENLSKAWAQLARIERKHGVLQRDVRMIDLRLPDRMVVRTGPGSDPVKPAPKPGRGEST